jgi:predicted kinase
MDTLAPILVCTVGLPRSGKTTWSLSTGLPVVCPDAIRLAMHGQRYLAEAEPWIWIFARTMVKSLFHAGHSTVIVDATNATRSRRDEWRSMSWQTLFHHLDTPLSVCLARAAGDPYIVPVI